jgi:hypothetical protein
MILIRLDGVREETEDDVALVLIKTGSAETKACVSDQSKTACLPCFAACLGERVVEFRAAAPIIP